MTEDLGPLEPALTEPVRGTGVVPTVVFPTIADRLWAIAEVVMCTDFLAGLAALAPFVALGVTRNELLAVPRYTCVFLLLQSIFLLAQIHVMLRIRGQSWRELGWTGSALREAARAVAFVPMLFAATLAVQLVLRYIWPSIVSESNELLEAITTKADLVFFLIAGALAGGVKEELQRAFVLRRFERYLGSIYLGWILWSIYFGFGHTIQGIDNAISAGVLGLLFGALYMARRNVVGPIVAHTLFNTITLIGFWFVKRG